MIRLLRRLLEVVVVHGVVVLLRSGVVRHELIFCLGCCGDTLTCHAATLRFLTAWFDIIVVDMAAVIRGNTSLAIVSDLLILMAGFVGADSVFLSEATSLVGRHIVAMVCSVRRLNLTVHDIL